MCEGFLIRSGCLVILIQLTAMVSCSIVLRPTSVNEASHPLSRDNMITDNLFDPLVVCTEEGLFPHPRNCSWFYRCAIRSNVDLFPDPRFHYKVYFSECPPGTTFESRIARCMPGHHRDCSETSDVRSRSSMLALHKSLRKSYSNQQPLYSSFKAKSRRRLSSKRRSTTETPTTENPTTEKQPSTTLSSVSTTSEATPTISTTIQPSSTEKLPTPPTDPSIIAEIKAALPAKKFRFIEEPKAEHPSESQETRDQKTINSPITYIMPASSEHEIKNSNKLDKSPTKHRTTQTGTNPCNCDFTEIGCAEYTVCPDGPDNERHEWKMCQLAYKQCECTGTSNSSVTSVLCETGKYYEPSSSSCHEAPSTMPCTPLPKIALTIDVPIVTSEEQVISCHLDNMTPNEEWILKRFCERRPLCDDKGMFLGMTSICESYFKCKFDQNLKKWTTTVQSCTSGYTFDFEVGKCKESPTNFCA